MAPSRDKDGGWAWPLLCACSVCSMLGSGMVMLAGMFQQVFLEEMRGGVVMTSWITSLFASLLQLAGPLSGLVSGVYGCRVAVMAGGVFLTMGLGLSAFCKSLTALLLAFGISGGLGLGLMYSAVIVAVNLSFVKYRPLATGVVLGSGGLGIIGMPVLCRHLLDAYSWQETLLFLSCITVHILVAGAMLFPPDAHAAGAGRRQAWCRPCCRSLKSRRTSNGEPVPDYTVSLLQEKDVSPRAADTIIHTETSFGVLSSQSKQDCYNDESHPAQPKEPGSAGTGTPSDSRSLRRAQTTESASVAINDKNADECESKECIEKQSVKQALLVTTNGADQENKNSDSKVFTKRATGGVSTSIESESFSTENVGTAFYTPERGSTIEGDLHSARSVCLNVQEKTSIANLTFESSEQKEVTVDSSLLSELYKNQNPPKDTKGHKSASQTLISKYISVLSNPSLSLFCLAQFLSNAGLGIVLVHFVTFCTERGSSFDDIALSFSANGVTVTVSRALVGLFAQDTNVDTLSVYIGLCLVASTVIVLIPVVAINTPAQIGVMALVGVYMGGAFTLVTEITIHCVGVDTLPVAFGLEMICGGLGYLVAPPIAGWLVEVTGSYSNAIFLAGFLEFLATFVAMAVSITRPVWTPRSRLADQELSVKPRGQLHE